MNRTTTILKFIIVYAILTACVDPIDFTSSAPPGELIILEGSITDDPGPYTINISRGVDLNSDTTVKASGAKIVLHNDAGESEDFTEVSAGLYQTGGVIRGVIGGVYYIQLEMPDGATFVSKPEKILPSGRVTNIHYQYEERINKTQFGDLPADVVNIYADADNLSSDNDSFVRWRFRGTYKVVTNPELHTTWLQGCCSYPTPWPCSGFEVEPTGDGGYTLVSKRPSTCSVCYVKDYESSPLLSDNESVANGQFRNIKITEVPITRNTFFDKYRVEVEQMTISKNAFDFLKVIRKQKTGVSDLFQAPPGTLRGNIVAVDAQYKIIGLFWAASITKNSIYIKQSDLPYKLPVDQMVYPCYDLFANSTTAKPDYWDE